MESHDPCCARPCAVCADKLVLLDLRHDARDPLEVSVPGTATARPPITGLAFFSAPVPELDSWWAESVPRAAHPIYVVDHDPGLTEWVDGLDGHFVVRLERDTSEPAIDAAERVVSVPADGPAEAVLRCDSGNGDVVVRWGSVRALARHPSENAVPAGPEQPRRPPIRHGDGHGSDGRRRRFQRARLADRHEELATPSEDGGDRRSSALTLLAANIHAAASASVTALDEQTPARGPATDELISLLSETLERLRDLKS